MHPTSQGNLKMYNSDNYANSSHSDRVTSEKTKQNSSQKRALNNDEKVKAERVAKRARLLETTTQTEAETDITLLPEIWRCIFQDLEYSTWQNCFLASKKFHQICLYSPVTATLLEEGCIPKIKEITLRWAAHSDSSLYKLNLADFSLTEEEFIHLFQRCTNIQELSLRGTTVKSNSPSTLIKYLPPNLQCLDLRNCQIVALESLKSLSALMFLVLGGTQITDDQLEHLKPLSTLHSLTLYKCKKITDDSVEHLKALSHLQSLSLSHCNISFRALASLSSLSALRSLHLKDANYVKDVDPLPLAYTIFSDHLRHLKALPVHSLTLNGFHYRKINDKGLEHLKTLPLHSLTLQSVNDKGLEHLKALPLQFLTLRLFNHITDKGLEHLKALPLRSLVIEDDPFFTAINNNYTHNCLQHLSALSTLQFLDLSLSKMNDQGLKHLQTLTGLQVLNLTSDKMTDQGLQYLTSLSALISLKLCSQNMTDNGLKHLLQSLSNLKYLDLRFIKMTGHGLEPLKRLPALQFLNLSLCKGMNDDSLKHLQAISTLKYLKLTNCNITDQGLEHLKTLSALKYLDLSGCKITDQGLKHLKELSHLRYLNLSAEQAKRCKISDEGLKCLQSLSALQFFCLESDIMISDEGLKHLKSFHHLKTLYLNNAKITDAGVEDLLKSLSNLQYLKLTHCPNINEAKFNHINNPDDYDEFSVLTSYKIAKKASEEFLKMSKKSKLFRSSSVYQNFILG